MLKTLIIILYFAFLKVPAQIHLPRSNYSHLKNFSPESPFNIICRYFRAQCQPSWLGLEATLGCCWLCTQCSLMTCEKPVYQFSLPPDLYQSGPRSHFQSHHCFLTQALHHQMTPTLDRLPVRAFWAQTFQSDSWWMGHHLLVKSHSKSFCSSLELAQIG